MATKQTEGRKLLCSWMAQHDLSDAEVGRAVGVSRNTIAAWCSGDAVPDAVHRPALRVLCGALESSWQTTEERQRRAGALAGAVAFARELKARSRRHGSKVTAAA